MWINIQCYVSISGRKIVIKHESLHVPFDDNISSPKPESFATFCVLPLSEEIGEGSIACECKVPTCMHVQVYLKEGCHGEFSNWLIKRYEYIIILLYACMHVHGIKFVVRVSTHLSTNQSHLPQSVTLSPWNYHQILHGVGGTA